MDYEIAAIQAVQAAFPGAQIFRCFYHLAKNMQKHLASIPNALHQYRHDADYALLCKAVLATAFVPRNRIDEALSTLSRQLPSNLYFLIDWFEDNYIGKYK